MTTVYEPGVEVSLILIIEDKEEIQPDPTLLEWENAPTAIEVLDVDEAKLLIGLDRFVKGEEEETDLSLYGEEWMTALRQVD